LPGSRTHACAICAAEIDPLLAPARIEAGRIVIMCSRCAASESPRTPPVVSVEPLPEPARVRPRKAVRRLAWLAPAAAAIAAWAIWPAAEHATPASAIAALPMAAAPTTSIHDSPRELERPPEVIAARPVEPVPRAPVAAAEHPRSARAEARNVEAPREVPPVVIDEESASDADHATHLVLKTSHGKVHVWAPRGYDAAHAGIVTYVHGYDTDVGEAWREHRLAAQFQASGRNALFIVPASPRTQESRLRWRSLDALFDAVRAEIDLAWPRGPSVVVGHSGAFRTIATWVGGSHVDHIDHVILLDGLYGARDRFDAWLDEDPRRRLTIIAGPDTRKNANSLARRHKDAVVRSVSRDDLSELAVDDRDARLLYLRTREDSHMWLVTGAEAIPELLCSTALEPVPPRIVGP
jgi:hypothetical protein